MKINFHDEVSAALHFDKPIVALESTVVAHGLPHPQNIETAQKLEQIIRENDATPATVALFNGDVYIGLNEARLRFLAESREIRKISRRDLPIAVARKLDCATTVATTAFLAHKAGIKVFATGGIGGVHRGDRTDVSADLPELAQTPIVVVCSGAKIVLDLHATREWLETNGVTILGWQCDELPAFYSRKSGLSIDERVESAAEVVDIIKARDEMGLKNSILVAVPVPEEFEMPLAEVEDILKGALTEAVGQGIRGKETTPFLLAQMSEKSGGKTLRANIALLENNAKVAAQVAVALSI